MLTRTERLFLGAADAATVYEADRSYDDGGLAFTPLARTARLAPAGASGECLFAALYVTISRAAGATVRVVPIVDGVALDATDIVLVEPAAGVITERHRIVVSQAYVDGGVELLRYQPRGAWMQAEVSVQGTPMLPVGAEETEAVIVDGVEVEFEVLRESLTPEAVP